MGVNVIKAAIADGILTSMWVFTLPLLGVSSGIISDSLGVQSIQSVSLLITLTLATVLITIFSILGNVLGGASFNPSSTICFIAAGLKPNSTIMSLAVRLPAQVAGGVLGAKAILKVMPSQYQHRLKGPSLKVDLVTGVVVEGALTFVICLVVMVLNVKGPKSMVLKVWLLVVAIVGCVIVGSGFTGPSMNPANAFGWAYAKNLHMGLEVHLVYGLGPLVGATLSAWVYRFLFGLQIKQKKA